MRSSDKKVNSFLSSQINKIFFQLIVDIKALKDAEVFAKDFFSEIELENFTKRLAIAYWLKKGRSYENIKDNLKVSSATIASVAETTKKEGMVLALKKLEAEEWASKWSEKIKKIVGK